MYVEREREREREDLKVGRRETGFAATASSVW
jgi:hypothetical protein